jgi:hypothetical protein
MMNEKYQIGKKCRNGAAYNPISLGYDDSPDGHSLRESDDDKRTRAMMRSKNLDGRANSGFNLITGIDYALNYR